MPPGRAGYAASDPRSLIRYNPMPSAPADRRMSADRSRPDEGQSPATSLFSVSQMQHVLRVEFGRALRYRYPLTVLVLSIDPLEPLRDRLGFDAKEAVVAAVARLLGEATRSADFLGRTPDDRLMAVVPHTGGDGARQLAERLLISVRELKVAEAPGERLTITIGGAVADDGLPLYHDALLSAAEDALAEASAQGGNRSTIRARPEPAA